MADGHTFGRKPSPQPCRQPAERGGHPWSGVVFSSHQGPVNGVLPQAAQKSPARPFSFSPVL